MENRCKDYRIDLFEDRISMTMATKHLIL